MKKKTVLLLLVMSSILLVAASSAFAFTPAAGDFFWEPYDFAAKVTKGAGGALIGLAGLGGIALSLMKGSVGGAVFSGVGAISIAAGPSTVTAMGLLF